MVNGRRHRKDFLDKYEAESWLKDKAREKTPKQGLVLAPISENTTPNTWLELYTIVYNRVWKGSKGEKSAKLNAKSVLDYFKPNNAYRHLSIEGIDAFTSHLEGIGNGDGTINRKLAALSKMLRFAHARGWIEKMPLIERKQEPLNRIRWLSDDEESSLLARFDNSGSPELADLCLFLVDTGARVGEALKLEWRDVDFQHKLVRFWDTKNGQARSIPITNRVAEMLIKREGLYPSHGPFRTVKQTTFNHKWVIVRRAMGLGKDDQFVPHALRHTCASRLVQRGVPILTVKEWLGHKSLAITLRYAHLAPKQLFDAVKVLEPNHDK
jgi:integrase